MLPTFRGKQGNPMLWDRRFFPEILQISGDSGARFLVGKHMEAVAEVEMADDAVLRDFDTTESLARCRAAAAEGVGEPNHGCAYHLAHGVRGMAGQPTVSRAMPICEADPWRFQYFEHVPCPENVPHLHRGLRIPGNGTRSTAGSTTNSRSPCRRGCMPRRTA